MPIRKKSGNFFEIDKSFKFAFAIAVEIDKSFKFAFAVAVDLNLKS